LLKNFKNISSMKIYNPVHEQRRETRASSAAERVEDQKALQTRALVGELASAVENVVDELLADRVVAARVIIRRVFLARDHLLWMEHLAVLAHADCIDNGWLQIDEDRAGHVATAAGSVEKSGERIVLFSFRLDEFSVSADSVL
jgi:hypothetical protein